MGKKMRFNVGDYVMLKTIEELNKLGISTKDINYSDDKGIIIQITEKKGDNDIIVVCWQQTKKEIKHPSSILKHISDKA